MESKISFGSAKMCLMKSCKKYGRVLLHIQRRAMKMVKGLKHMSDEEQLWEQVVHPGKKEAEG